MPRPGGIPDSIPVVDTMIGFVAAVPGVDRELPQVRGAMRGTGHSADYMFREIPAGADAPVAATLGAMDRHGVDVGLISTSSPVALAAAAAHPDRFVLETHVGTMGEPFDIVGAVSRIRDEHDEFGTRAVSMFPVGPVPSVPVDSAAAYPIYATCVELGLPCFVNAGVPGPRVPMAAQHVERFDQVCYDFPELTVVMRHGTEPWTDLAVKLMLKWPGLHVSTSAFAPKHYPAAVLDYLNTRGAQKVMYGGYFPMALTLDRIFAELDGLATAGRIRPDRWESFLSGNARRILGLKDG
ncbi:MAG: amidohydrolase family protein [Acidimicrobiales bacterium]|nr:amidohydrolase family protein [Acidimicrobiales bacterium]